MNIEEFCDKYHACHDGRTWALKNCTTMDEVWKKCLRPEWIIWIATRPGVLKDTDLIRFAVWSVRQVQHLLTDPRGLAALDTVDRYLAGTATKEEVEAAADAAYDAARAAYAAAYAARAAADAAYAAARAADAAAYAARAAADAAAYAARAAADAAYAAYAAARAAADAAARAAYAAAYAAYAAARAAARADDAAYAAQAEWLRKNTVPKFK